MYKSYGKIGTEKGLRYDSVTLSEDI